MARPKQLKKPTPINLLVDDQVKKKAMKLAFNRKTSVSRLFSAWIEEQEAKDAA